ncbi:MAG: glycosyltransferase [Bacteroidales bacterium]|nr:glycosyltransferase [Bacteroidales bacterium]
METDDIFLMVARVLYDKGYQEYVDAAAIVKQKYPNVGIELLGATDFSSPMGVPKSVLEKDIADGKITYLGVTNDVPSYLRRENVVVVIVSSYREGLNRALMEACAMGKPIITTDIPGCKETVDEGVNGFLVPVKNASALANAMIKYIELSDNEKEKMKQASHQKAIKQFDVKYVLEQYDKIIDEIL